MLLDPSSPRLDAAPPAADTPATPELPEDLGALLSRARRDRGSALALVHLLLERGWSAATVGTVLDGRIGLTRTQVEALATVRRPRTSASAVADRLVASRRPLARVPHQRCASRS